jgi:hypothetical protein
MIFILQSPNPLQQDEQRYRNGMNKTVHKAAKKSKQTNRLVVRAASKIYNIIM